MADRELVMPPPTPEYRQVGWHCIYHEQQGRMCHNPLDCDLIPIWALTVEAAKEVIRNQNKVKKTDGQE